MNEDLDYGLCCYYFWSMRFGQSKLKQEMVGLGVNTLKLTICYIKGYLQSGLDKLEYFNSGLKGVL